MENIVNKILEEAKAEAKEMLAKAETSSKKQISNAKIEIEENKESLVEQARAKAERDARQNEMQAKTIAARKQSNDKQEIVSAVFNDAKAKILAMSASERKKLVDGLIKKHGRKDDKITEHDGGVILENKDYVLSLTVSDLLEHLRQEIELEVVGILFS